MASGTSISPARQWIRWAPRCARSMQTQTVAFSVNAFFWMKDGQP
jgi:hypothetical protein